MPNGAFNICCPRDCVSRHNGGTAGAPLKTLRVDSALKYATRTHCSCVGIIAGAFFFSRKHVKWVISDEKKRVLLQNLQRNRRLEILKHSFQTHEYVVFMCLYFITTVSQNSKKEQITLDMLEFCHLWTREFLERWIL